jgi:hypothetical protein
VINKQVNDLVSRQVEYNHVPVDKLKIPMKIDEAALYTVTRVILYKYFVKLQSLFTRSYTVEQFLLFIENW